MLDQGNFEYLVKEFRGICGKAFELEFDVIQHVSQEDEEGSRVISIQR